MGVQVWRIENFEPTEQPADGTFTAGDCYVVLYSYGDGGASHIVYMWQGAQASQDERGACAAAAVKIDEQYAGGAAPQVRHFRVRCPLQHEPMLRTIALFRGTDVALPSTDTLPSGTVPRASYYPSCYMR